MTTANRLILRFMKIAAVVCLVAVLATASVQTIHMHAGSTRLDAHCSLCMVSHCVPRPQGSAVVAPTVRVVRHTTATVVITNPSSGIFYWFVRPPPPSA